MHLFSHKEKENISLNILNHLEIKNILMQRKAFSISQLNFIKYISSITLMINYETNF